MMAIKKVKRWNLKKQSTHGTKSGARSQKSGNKKQSALSIWHSVKARSNTKKKSQPRVDRRTTKPSPAEYALRERTLPGRRFVEFPLVEGKIAEKVQLFTTTNYHSLTIEFQDRTSLHLDIDPGFTVSTKFMRSEKGDLETLAEWPPIHISSEQP